MYQLFLCSCCSVFFHLAVGQTLINQHFPNVNLAGYQYHSCQVERFETPSSMAPSKSSSSSSTSSSSGSRTLVRPLSLQAPVHDACSKGKNHLWIYLQKQNGKQELPSILGYVYTMEAQFCEMCSVNF
jgi:hypothetical protein